MGLPSGGYRSLQERIRVAEWPLAVQVGRDHRGVGCFRVEPSAPGLSLVLNNITRGIFETIVEQAPLAIEDLLNELHTRDDQAAADSDESSEGGERRDTLPRKRSERPPAGGGTARLASPGTVSSVHADRGWVQA
ncbi:hypothetical protein P7K49_032477 [Saguinus oedipus]|uniref:Uncharacterized protein n=1 Tax=Saguinus oedipus TaxID=9490 RepID=A0ABQ9TZ16_SAGOE|nr:hypothetical protein P7K49_032477 [Saguinus oedipus]